jgi:hypothetical protein
MGFHEGARRTVTCDGGYITGFDAYMSHLGGFAEPTLNAIRVVCSSSRIQVEYETGSLPDTMVFGQLPPEVANLVQPVKGGSKGIRQPAQAPLLASAVTSQEAQEANACCNSHPTDGDRKVIPAEGYLQAGNKPWHRYQAGVVITVSG